jgi:hypothetical protein
VQLRPPKESTRQLNLDPIGIVDGSKVTLGCSTLDGGHHFDALHHEPDNSPTPLQGPAPPLLGGPFLVQGFSQRLGIPVHDAPLLKRLLLLLNLRPQLPIALSGELLHPLRGIEGGPLKRELLVLKLGVAIVDSGNLGRVKSMLI